MVLPDQPRREAFWRGFFCLNAPTGAWCSLTIMSALLVVIVVSSQCTYRCVVLPDLSCKTRSATETLCLNAPTGAWCSLTVKGRLPWWLFNESQCTYRCVVLPDWMVNIAVSAIAMSQCTYRCVVLPDPCLRERRYDATSRARSATGPGSTPADRPAPGSD